MQIDSARFRQSADIRHAVVITPNSVIAIASTLVITPAHTAEQGDSQ